MEPSVDPARTDRVLAAALAAPLPDERADGDADELLTLEELADRAGLSLPLLEAVAQEGFLVPQVIDGTARYSPADAGAVRAGMRLLEAGLPLGELLDLARGYDAAMREVADRAVEVFARFVRDPAIGTAADEQEAADRLVAAFEQMLPATSHLVAHHFRRLLVASARTRLDEEPA